MTTFLYLIRTRKGALVYGEGETWEQAAIGIKIKPEDVLRHLPVKVVESSEEIERRLANKKAAANRLKQYRKEQKAEKQLRKRAAERSRRNGG